MNQQLSEMFAKVSHEYDDIIMLPHHTSKTRPRMSLADRAAQFSPFAALTGFEDAIADTAEDMAAGRFSFPNSPNIN